MAMADGRTARIFTPVAAGDWCAHHPELAQRMTNPLAVDR